jgi:2'-5' RNA ligase
MYTTSHFIGLKIKPEILVNLFVKLQNLVQEDPYILEFQNILSAHITLYYLPPALSPEVIESIRNLITTTNISLPDWHIEWLDYFGEENSPRICYLVPDKRVELEKLYDQFKGTFPEFSGVLENTYPVFIPHITLFKIKNRDKFLTKKSEIESLIQEEVALIWEENIFEDIKIYRVSSQFRPEIQISL